MFTRMKLGMERIFTSNENSSTY